MSLCPQVEELTSSAQSLDVRKQQLEVIRLFDEVEALAVDDQQRCVLVLVEVSAVGVGQPRQVMFRDAALVVDAALVHALDQGAHRGLEVDDEVRGRRLGLEVRIHLFVECELLVAQVEAREKRILVEKEVCYRRAPKQVELGEVPDLVDALEQEVELRRQGEARHVRVEAPQEGILLRRLEQGVAIEVRGEGSGEARLARADGPLDDDVAALLEIHGGGAGLTPECVSGARDALLAHAAQQLPRCAAAGYGRSGRNTKARSCMRGCGTTSRDRVSRRRPNSSKSRSSRRGALRPLCRRLRP